ncbi:MAG: anhydro-N-acetylmuramic acid kinase [Saprospiraceae bacterium]
MILHHSPSSMPRTTLHLVGLMSGSSLDGIDLALCRFDFDDALSGNALLDWKLLSTKTIPYTEIWKTRLQGAPSLSGRDLWLLHTELGRLYGHVILDFLREVDREVDAIASHGHTVFHFPHQGTTTQIGDGAVIAGVTGAVVIDQFRSLDMALGGQGAPLAPLGDLYFFNSYTASLNLGGIANISVKTPRGYVAFDNGGANQVLDALAQEAGLPFDAEGQLARSGQLIPTMKAQADALPYYALPYPKSLGNDWVQEVLLPIFQQPQYAIADRLHTCCQHIAHQIAKDLQLIAEQEQLTLSANDGLIISGGGGFNTFLCECITQAVAPMQTTQAPAALIGFKEAAFIALAGALRLLQQPNVLPSATGATRAAIGGAVHWGRQGINLI